MTLDQPGQSATYPRVIPRAEHTVSRSNISEHAAKVLHRLKGAGYAAHLVGGGVRDLLLGREPKDFDVATDAPPDEVRQLFRNCRLIGRRFRLAHVRFGREIIEVATFRAGFDGADREDARLHNGRIIRDNVYGTQEEDAWRRDFTVNALYYNIADFSVVDYVGGYEDLKAGVLRLIGDPVQRYREDPVRMLRAVRFAAKLGFRIHPDSEAPLFEMGPLLEDIPAARLFDEVLKLFHGGAGLQTYELLRHYGLFQHLFPQTDVVLCEEEHGFPHILLATALRNTDDRILSGKPVTPAFLFAALLWEPTRKLAERLRAEQSMSVLQAIQVAGDQVLAEQRQRITIPKRFSQPVREIWAMQERLTVRKGGRPLRLVDHPRFRAAYDFMLLRNEAGEDIAELCQWWTRFQELPEAQRRDMVLTGDTKRRRRRRRRPASSAPKQA